MKKWLDNWTLKQEYLVNLRKQFACDSARAAHLIQVLRQSPSSSSGATAGSADSESTLAEL